VVQDDDGVYHLLASEIAYHCGIHRWLAQSQVVHATSTDPVGPYKREGTVFPIFTHEPAFLRAPTGEWITYVTHVDGTATKGPPFICNCTDGNSGSGGKKCWGEQGRNPNVSLWTWISVASSPYGPWSDLQLCNHWDGLPTSDMNFVAAFKPDGTLLAMNRWDIVEASDWKNMSTYKDVGRYLRGGLKYGAGEDPDIWQDGNGVWHMLSHNGNRGGHPSDGTGDCGRHWFSETGEHGTFDSAPTTVEKKGGCAYNRTAVFQEANGELVTRLFYRRERPHIVLDRHGKMQALLTSVIDNPEINSQHNSDASYTLFQRIIM